MKAQDRRADPRADSIPDSFVSQSYSWPTCNIPYHKIYLNVLRGSNASRTASPMKISNDNMMATAKKPVKPSHGAWTLALPCDSNSPSDGEPGGKPKPRKSSAGSVMTDEDTMKGRNVMVAT